MPKVTWEDDDLSADEINNAEDGFQQYTGDLPPGGVYRFKIARAKYMKWDTGTQGLNIRMELDGSWKSAHKKFDGYVLWDRIFMTKGSASFLKAFAAGIGVSAADLVNKVVIDDDNVVTKIGRKSPEGLMVYLAVKRESYEGEPRLAKAGTGYQLIESDADDDAEDVEETPPAKPAKGKAAKAATKGKAKGKAKNDDDEPPF